MVQKLIIFLILSVTPAFAAIASTARWNVRTDGANTNGGCFDPGVASPGTDYGAQASAQVAFTDLVIGATNTQLTSAGNPFSSASVGNCIDITSGTGFTTGWYEVTSVTGTTATMDRAVGTASSTGGHGNLGGALLTLAQASTNLVSGNTVNVKNGTYTLTSAVAITNSSIWSGYNSTYNDITTATSTRPLITTATNSVGLIASGTSVALTLKNLQLTTTASTKYVGIYATGHLGVLQVINVYGSGFGGSTDGGPFIDNTDSTNYDYNSISIEGSEVTSSSLVVKGSSADGTYYRIRGNYFHGNVQDIIISLNTAAQASVYLALEQNIFSGSTSTTAPSVYLNGNQTPASSAGTPVYDISNNDWYNTGWYALQLDQYSTSGIMPYVCMSNNVFYGNYAAVDAFSASVFTACRLNNAYGGNTNASNHWTSDPTDITLTANPWTSSTNFQLNSTSGGGPLLKQTAYPTFFGTTTTNDMSGGAVQPASGGTTTTVPSGYAD